MPELRAATPRVVQALAKQAMDGDVRAARLWLQYVEGWNPRDPNETSMETDVEINIGEDDDEES